MQFERAQRFGDLVGLALGRAGVASATTSDLATRLARASATSSLSQRSSAQTEPAASSVKPPEKTPSRRRRVALGKEVVAPVEGGEKRALARQRRAAPASRPPRQENYRGRSLLCKAKLTLAIPAEAGMSPRERKRTRGGDRLSREERDSCETGAPESIALRPSEGASRRQELRFARGFAAPHPPETFAFGRPLPASRFAKAPGDRSRGEGLSAPAFAASAYGERSRPG